MARLAWAELPRQDTMNPPGLSRVWPRALTGWLALALAAGSAAAAQAQSVPAIDVQTVHASAAPGDSLLLRSARGQAAYTWSLQGSLDYQRQPLSFSAAGQRQTVVGDLAMLHLGAYVALPSDWAVGATLPVAGVIRGGGPNLAQLQTLPSGPALGDLRLEGRKHWWHGPALGGELAFATAVDAILPTASAGNWQGGAGALGLDLLASGNWGPWRGDLALGGRWSPTQELVLHPLDGNSVPIAGQSFVALRSGSQFRAGAAVGRQLLDDLLLVRGELAAALPLVDTVASSQGVVDAAVTGDYAFTPWLHGLAMVGGSPSGGPGAAALRLWAGVRIVPSAMPSDVDLDGLDDRVDKCPEQAEDKDGFEDGDGCPDLDDDGDGVPDTVDKCRRLAEDLDGFQDDDGCPDPDNDGDGILDKDDLCPKQPENFNGFEDGDGCPDVKPGDAPAALEPPKPATPVVEAAPEPAPVVPATPPAKPGKGGKAGKGAKAGQDPKAGKAGKPGPKPGPEPGPEPKPEAKPAEPAKPEPGKAKPGNPAKPYYEDPLEDRKPRAKVPAVPTE